MDPFGGAGGGDMFGEMQAAFPEFTAFEDGIIQIGFDFKRD